MQFEFRASVEQTEQAFLRAGISANANIVLITPQPVVAVQETDLALSQASPTSTSRRAPASLKRLPTGLPTA